MSSIANIPLSELDQQFIEHSLSLAKKGLYSTAPNPMVGCVIVQDGVVIGEGWHEKAGQDHAEKMALTNANVSNTSKEIRGSTAYISLEPCCHQGRTPPCTDALIDAGVSRVVAAMSDPNPMVAGGGFDVLRAAGIEVTTDLLREKAIWLNRGFVNRMKIEKPWVKLKSAATLDGRTASYTGESKWITSEKSRNEVQQLRAQCSAVITGIGTVLADNANMNVRLDAADRQPYRILLDSNLQLPLDANIIGNDGMLHVFTGSTDNEKINQLKELGVEIIVTDASPIDLHEVLNYLSKLQCNNVLVEAGRELSGSFIENDLVDELVIYYAPSILGADARGMFSNNIAIDFQQRRLFKFTDVMMVGDDIRANAIKPESLQRIQA